MKKTEKFLLSVDEETARVIREQAERDHRKYQEQIRVLVEEALETRALRAAEDKCKKPASSDDPTFTHGKVTRRIWIALDDEQHRFIAEAADRAFRTYQGQVRWLISAAMPRRPALPKPDQDDRVTPQSKESGPILIRIGAENEARRKGRAS